MNIVRVQRATVGVVAGALLGLVPTVMVATGQMSPPDSPPVSPPTTVLPIGVVVTTPTITLPALTLPPIVIPPGALPSPRVLAPLCGALQRLRTLSFLRSFADLFRSLLGCGPVDGQG